MKAGRAGVLSTHHNQYSHPKENKSFLVDYQQSCEKYQGQLQILKFQAFPLGGWFLGLLLIVISITLLYFLIEGGPEYLKGLHEGKKWWQYFVVIVFFIMGISFLSSLKYEKVILNKNINKISIIRTNFFCKEKIQERDLQDILIVNVVKRGQDRISNKTLHYKVLFTFNAQRPLECLESGSKFSITKKLIQINAFLNRNLQIKDIAVIDQSRDLNPDNRV